MKSPKDLKDMMLYRRVDEINQSQNDLASLADRAEEANICIDRVLMVMVAGLMRSWVSTPGILDLVEDGMALAAGEGTYEGGRSGGTPRMH